ncbi:acetyl-CoA carboxylase [Paraburkholderia fungorum]|jgi:acetyl-CoA carboxylase biotin carboxyl carrier protein|uniref:acetyl-CoA carboxylase n=1 Tax=Paraburkholderia fungorum TaxID=134537 RepID=UPI002093460A|nr:acetyl-CoA carboxylase [Paraburkholderia fungorum]MDE1008272.1 acetyl-CoA carboxylase [Paraburkholderia fungorum]USU17762.1 acetyl-CoA carboxylase [Paraburkholderia fungorum]USU25706.1 acetyl-CoA carboxylase [Paraburkholderia fungorum]
MPIHEILSPLPGTFYRRAAPDQPYFVEVDSTVASGAVVGLVEVMKQFTEVESHVSGRVVEVTVEDGEPVDAGQVIIRIEE